MIVQVIDGVAAALGMLLVAYLGYVMFYFGKIIAGDRSIGRRAENVTPKWKAALVAGIVAAVLGALAATPHAERTSGDYLFDPGEVIEVSEVKMPTRQFCQGFVFSLVAMLVGIVRSERD
jgi:hypothetical protein